MSGNIKNYSKDKGYELIPRGLLQDTDRLSLQAIGLLCNLQSYPEDWELHKTEVYRRYKKNKKTSVSSAWEELVEAKYIAQLRRRNGKKWDYIYYFNLEPFTDEQIEEIETKENAKCLSFRFSEAQNGKPKMGSPKSESNILTQEDITQEDITQEQEEEEEAPSELMSFLLSKDIKPDNAKRFEDKLVESNINGYTFDDVEEALYLSFEDFQNGICKYDPYVWAVGKLERLVDSKNKKIVKLQKPSNKYQKKNTSTEVIPDWFIELKNKKKQNKKSAPDQLDQEQEEVKNLLQNYKLNS